MLRNLNDFFRNIFSFVFDIDDTSLPKEQFSLIESQHRRFYREISCFYDSVEHFSKALLKKHFLDSISVFKKDGSIVFSSNGDSLAEGIKISSLFNYIESEMPKTQSVMIKQGVWHIIYHKKDFFYLIRAKNNLALPELEAISKEVELFFARKS
ncbi:MAG: hypothetical protein N3D73_00815 [Candidatus Diapherotrites archaeon]|nr:hypothetical protein [Candidatus Diapherotrites archaeon]